MNPKMIHALADKLENLDEDRFRISVFWAEVPDDPTFIEGIDHYDPKESECHTVGCIAGWAVAFFAPEIMAKVPVADAEDVINFTREAADLLGLGYHEADHLFIPEGCMFDGKPEPTAKECAAVLREVADGLHPANAWEEHFAKL